MSIQDRFPIDCRVRLTHADPGLTHFNGKTGTVVGYNDEDSWDPFLNITLDGEENSRIFRPSNVERIEPHFKKGMSVLVRDMDGIHVLFRNQPGKVLHIDSIGRVVVALDDSSIIQRVRDPFTPITPNVIHFNPEHLILIGKFKFKKNEFVRVNGKHKEYGNFTGKVQKCERRNERRFYNVDFLSIHGALNTVTFEEKDLCPSRGSRAYFCPNFLQGEPVTVRGQNAVVTKEARSSLSAAYRVQFENGRKGSFLPSQMESRYRVGREVEFFNGITWAKGKVQRVDRFSRGRRAFVIGVETFTGHVREIPYDADEVRLPVAKPLNPSLDDLMNNVVYPYLGAYTKEIMAVQPMMSTLLDGPRYPLEYKCEFINPKKETPEMDLKFKVGDAVEALLDARHGSNKEVWRKGKVTRVDDTDPGLPYFVDFDGDAIDGWTHNDRLRPAGVAAPKPVEEKIEVGDIILDGVRKSEPQETNTPAEPDETPTPEVEGNDEMKSLIPNPELNGTFVLLGTGHHFDEEERVHILLDASPDDGGKVIGYGDKFYANEVWADHMILNLPSNMGDRILRMSYADLLSVHQRVNDLRSQRPECDWCREPVPFGGTEYCKRHAAIARANERRAKERQARREANAPRRRKICRVLYAAILVGGLAFASVDFKNGTVRSWVKNTAQSAGHFLKDLGQDR